MMGALSLLLFLACGDGVPAVFEDEAAFKASFATFDSGPIRAEEASLGEDPRHTYSLAYPPGEYQIHTKNSSILALSAFEDRWAKKRKECWYHLSVSEPNSEGLSTYRLKLIRNRFHKNPRAKRPPSRPGF